MVGIYKEYFGRGPTWAQATLADNHVTVLLGDALTLVEQRLAAEGNHETVRSLRRTAQESLARDMSDLVSRVTGRQVKCLLSDHDPATDTAVEVLVFEDGGASRQAPESAGV